MKVSYFCVSGGIHERLVCGSKVQLDSVIVPLDEVILRCLVLVVDVNKLVELLQFFLALAYSVIVNHVPFSHGGSVFLFFNQSAYALQRIEVVVNCQREVASSFSLSCCVDYGFCFGERFFYDFFAVSCFLKFRYSFVKSFFRIVVSAVEQGVNFRPYVGVKRFESFLDGFLS